MECAPKRLLWGSRRPAAQLGQTRQEHVELELRALGLGRPGAGCGSTPGRGATRSTVEQSLQHGRGAVREHVPGGDPLPVGERHLGVNTIARDGHDLGVGPQRRPGAPRGGREAIRHRAHPADGHVPAAGSVADHVVEEAPVLTQLRIVGGRERSDEPVGQGNPAGLVVAHRALKQLGQRRLEQRAPPRLADEPRASPHGSAAAR